MCKPTQIVRNTKDASLDSSEVEIDPPSSCYAPLICYAYYIKYLYL